MTDDNLITLHEWNAKLRELRLARERIAVLESRLRAESAQEPVAWITEASFDWLKRGSQETYGPSLTFPKKHGNYIVPLYAAPVAAQDCLARYGIHSEGQPLTPYGVQLIDDLASLVRRLRYQLKKHDPDNQLAAQADEYLRRYDLQGNPLRYDEEPK